MLSLGLIISSIVMNLKLAAMIPIKDGYLAREEKSSGNLINLLKNELRWLNGIRISTDFLLKSVLSWTRDTSLGRQVDCLWKSIS